ncbi:helix-turn-helix transcriptional regulator [Gordonia asplenii]|nr:helix-turn-helix transcriptional regulator [Gordonia asplenii]
MIESELDGVSRIVSAVGTCEFGASVDEFLRHYVEFDMTCIFAFHPSSTPLLIHDGYSASVSRNALSSYLKGGYLLDPFYVACTSDVGDGLWRMADVAPDEFFVSDFAASHEVHPCISDESGTLIEEIGYVVTLADGWRATYSLMRNRCGEQFSDDQFAGLTALAPLLSAAIRRHVELVSATSSERRPGEIESVLQRAFCDRLTAAQFRVVNLILRGHSSQSVAKELHITEGTAKLHRHNAYQRLGVTSQAELFRMFIDYLEV